MFCNTMNNKLISSLITKIKESDFNPPLPMTMQKKGNYFHLTIDKELSITLEGDKLSINGKPASQHNFRMLLEANRLKEMLQLKTHETPCFLLGSFAAGQGYKMANLLEHGKMNAELSNFRQ